MRVILRFIVSSSLLLGSKPVFAAYTSWFADQCEALLGAVVIEELGRPKGHFFYTHSLAHALSRSIPESLLQFYQQTPKGVCTYECLTAQAEVALKFLRHKSHQLISGDYSHWFAGDDPIYGPVKIRLTEQILPPAFPYNPAADNLLRSRLTEAEEKVLDLLRAFLQPRVLDALALWTRLGEKEEAGKFIASSEPYKMLWRLVQKGAKPSFADELFSDAQATLAVLLQEQRGQDFHYSVDRAKHILKVFRTNSEVTLKFTADGNRILEMNIAHRGTQGDIHVTLDVQFAEGDMWRLRAGYDKEWDKILAAGLDKLRHVKRRIELEEQASDGTYSKREHQETAFEPKGPYVVFALKDQSMSEQVRFLMSDSWRPLIFVINGQEYSVTYMYDGQIDLAAESGIPPLTGSYSRATMEQEGLQLNMLVVTLKPTTNPYF